MKYFSLIYLLFFTSSGFACDEFSINEVRILFDNCVNDTINDLAKLSDELYGFCSKLDELMECNDYLRACNDYYLIEADERLSQISKLDELEVEIDQCFNLDLDVKISNRSKRSPRKSSGSGRGSRVRAGVKKATAAIRDKVIPRLINRQKQKIGGSKSHHGGSSGLSKLKKNKGLLKKVGGVAVAGLAAYGTYKLAKKMSKALRGSYDDDDCWEYNIFQGQYECVCPNQCQIYVGSVATLISSLNLIFIGLFATIYAHYRY